MAFVETIKDVINWLTAPSIFITLATVALFATINWRGFWRPRIALVMGVLGTIFLGLSMLDPDFFLIVRKPDNVPIVAMLFLVGFFLWLSMYQAYENDDRIAAGKAPMEASDGEAD